MTAITFEGKNSKEFENAPEQPSRSSTISIKEDHFANSRPRLHRQMSLKGERDSQMNNSTENKRPYGPHT